MKTTTPSQRTEKLRKAVMSAATLMQDVPVGEVPDEDLLDFVESDLRVALGLIEDIQETQHDEV